MGDNPKCRIGQPDCDCAEVPEVVRFLIPRAPRLDVRPEATFRYDGPVAGPVEAARPEPTFTPPRDEVNQPKHYTSHPSGVECIQVTEHMNFNLGNAVKYIWRASLKGKERQDLEKAIWYLQRELKRLYGEK